jgi:hypothetical protein
VGTSVTGAAGTFSASGKNSISTSGTITYPAEWFSWGSHQFKTEFIENEYYSQCIQTLTGAESTTYYNKVDGWQGGSQVISVGRVNASNGAPYAGGTSFTKSTTNAWTFGTGMSIPYINFNASTETRYTVSASVTYSFNPGDDRYLGGIGSPPGGSGPLLLKVKP